MNTVQYHATQSNSIQYLKNTLQYHAIKLNTSDKISEWYLQYCNWNSQYWYCTENTSTKNHSTGTGTDNTGTRTDGTDGTGTDGTGVFTDIMELLQMVLVLTGLAFVLTLLSPVLI